MHTVCHVYNIYAYHMCTHMYVYIYEASYMCTVVCLMYVVLYTRTHVVHCMYASLDVQSSQRRRLSYNFHCFCNL